MFMLAACAAKPSDDEIAARCGVSLSQLQAARTQVKAGSVEKLGEHCQVGKDKDGAAFIATIEQPGSKKN